MSINVGNKSSGSLHVWNVNRDTGEPCEVACKRNWSNLTGKPPKSMPTDQLKKCVKGCQSEAIWFFALISAAID